ncbi:hypothetical protein BDY21DRAFT_107600 [Lineolata rhizophorae]|uniref:Transmembrane protein n=1 Tax=Lineolata rhizophorae TaxID=578093 RepID=A0A6A6NR92_9PEZI|nr:hypothetical protein BDY21DRAFT_107600 [Lineolata rhizophorae]
MGSRALPPTHNTCLETHEASPSAKQALTAPILSRSHIAQFIRRRFPTPARVGAGRKAGRRVAAALRRSPCLKRNPAGNELGAFARGENPSACVVTPQTPPTKQREAIQLLLTIDPLRHRCRTSRSSAAAYLLLLYHIRFIFFCLFFFNISCWPRLTATATLLGDQTESRNGQSSTGRDRLHSCSVVCRGGISLPFFSFLFCRLNPLLFPPRPYFCSPFQSFR